MLVSKCSQAHASTCLSNPNEETLTNTSFLGHTTGARNKDDLYIEKLQEIVLRSRWYVKREFFLQFLYKTDDCSVSSISKQEDEFEGLFWA